MWAVTVFSSLIIRHVLHNKLKGFMTIALPGQTEETHDIQDLRSSGILRIFLDCLTLEDGTDTLSRKVVN
jgi:hypothetical protein